MKILEIIPALNSGGAERFVVDLCNELAFKGEDVTLVVLHNISKNGFYYDQISPEVRVLSMNKNKGVDLLLPFRLARLIRKEKPKVVHTHLIAVVYSILYWLFPHSNKTLFVHTLHSNSPQEGGGRLGLFIRKVAFHWNRVKPVNISEVSQQSFFKVYSLPSSLIFNGRNVPADLQVSGKTIEEVRKFKRTEHTRLLVCLAHISPVKRHEVLARVTARLFDEGYDFAILAIGSTRNEQLVGKVKSQAKENFHILGERQNPLEYLKMADGFALCSSYEGLPISLIEALGEGAVPVCTPVGGIKDLVHDGDNGFLSADTSEEAYYEAMKRFLNLNDDELQRMSKNALKSYEPFSMTACAEKYLELFKKNSTD